MAQPDTKGIRVFHFKDFCYEQSGTTPPYLFWDVNNSGMDWVTITNTGHQPWESMDGYMAHYYEVNPPSPDTSSPNTCYLLKSKTLGTWASTMQGLSDRRYTMQYDFAMRITDTSSSACFVFCWYGTGANQFAYRINMTDTLVTLDKLDDGNANTEADWATMEEGTMNPAVGTWYWFRVEYTPADIYVGDRLFSAGGTIEVRVDDSHLKQGLGSLEKFTAVDSGTPITSGMYLGIGAQGGSTSHFLGMTFADGFIGQRRMPIMVNRYLFEKQHGIMLFRVFYARHDTMAVQPNDRVEIWIGGEDENGNPLRVLDFDGVVKKIKFMQREQVAWCVAVEESYEFATREKNNEPSTSNTSYYDYLIDAYFGEQPGTVREDFSRMYISGINPNIFVSAPAEDWSWYCAESEFIKYLINLHNAWAIWTPEGFFIITDNGISTGNPNFMFNPADASDPQPIYSWDVSDDFIHHYNHVLVSNNTSVPSESQDAASQTQRGKKTKRVLYKKAPSTETSTTAANLLAQWSDESPFVDVLVLNFQPHFQPGYCVKMVIPDRDFYTEMPCIILQKEYFVGDWSGIADYTTNAIRYKMAYFDPNASPIVKPRMSYEDEENIKKTLKELIGDISILY